MLRKKFSPITAPFQLILSLFSHSIKRFALSFLGKKWLKTFFVATYHV